MQVAPTLPTEDSSPSSSEPTPQRPIRVLHVVGAMNRGGVETWLMHVLRHIDRARYKMDFLVHTTEPAAYDDEIRTLGSRVIPCPLDKRNPLSYAQRFTKILREEGPFDVVHSHVHHFSGFVLWLAKRAGVRGRVAHSHNDTRCVERNTGLPRRTYLAAQKRLVNLAATQKIGCSRDAAADLFGPDWERDPITKVIYCGIDLTPFSAPIDPSKVRAELGIPQDAFVMGHVGRFAPQKNHTFLLDIAAEVMKQKPNCYLLLVGTGLLESEIREKASRLGIANKVIFAGSRDDVPRLMRGAMDVFVFPSLHEGLPLVLIEAQAAGLPCVISSLVPEEAIISGPLVRSFSLTTSAPEWASNVDFPLPKPLLPATGISISSINPKFNISGSLQEISHFAWSTGDGRTTYQDSAVRMRSMAHKINPQL